MNLNLLNRTISIVNDSYELLTEGCRILHLNSREAQKTIQNVKEVLNELNMQLEKELL